MNPITVNNSLDFIADARHMPTELFAMLIASQLSSNWNTSFNTEVDTQFTLEKEICNFMDNAPTLIDNEKLSPSDFVLKFQEFLVETIQEKLGLIPVWQGAVKDNVDDQDEWKAKGKGTFTVSSDEQLIFVGVKSNDSLGEVEFILLTPFADYGIGFAKPSLH